MTLPRNEPKAALREWIASTDGRVLMTGVQALTRLPITQRRRDKTRGLNTAGYVTGYRGSPLTGLDMLIERNSEVFREADTTFQPGINEEIAATACWGTQQIDALPGRNVDGVFAMWYGKGPGVERACDALRHGNQAGSHENGGVLVVYGDDHPGKSSSTAHQSDQTLAAVSIPCLYPADVQDYLLFGLLGWEMSRFTGSWVGLKCVNETIDQTMTVDLGVEQIQARSPALTMADLPSQGVHIRPRTFVPAEFDMIVTRYRLPLVKRFVRANGIDRVAFGAAQPKFGIVTAGKSYRDVMQALALLGVDTAEAETLGIGVYKIGCIWPLEPEGLTEFGQDADVLFVAEEKRAFIELQARDTFYNAARRPTIIGKTDARGEFLLPSDVQLQPIDIARAIVGQVRDPGARTILKTRLDALDIGSSAAAQPLERSLTRAPYFCSGCPHGRSTQVPEGSLAFGGIGCHGMAVARVPFDTMPPTQMGGEGAPWIGLSRYSDTAHVFQNLGDGTYYHSGILSIRAAIAANVNITFKILYNDAVAMTGGQHFDGPMTVESIARQVMAEGVKRCVVASEQPERFTSGSLPADVGVYARTELPRLQEELRESPGCTVIIYDQTCAAEKRRRRKKADYPDPPKRMYIYDAVCEGCGDCSAVSTCVSIQPKDTPLGTKRQIDQSSCNKDFSCAEGFCPSFVTVLDAEPKKPEMADLGDIGADLPMPARTTGTRAIMIAGIGGTGVITVGAIIARAAHTDGLFASTYDMTGVAQKNGAVFSHLKVSDSAGGIRAQRVGMGEADLVLAFDLLAAIQPESANTIRAGHTQVIGNADVTETAFFQMERSDAGRPQKGAAAERLRKAAGEDHADFIEATEIALKLCGDTIAVNLMLVGYALQKGLLPVSLGALEDAIELNGVAVAFNKRALLLGRVLAHDPRRLAVPLADIGPRPPQTLDQVIADAESRLTGFQGSAWARRYHDAIAQVRATAGDSDFTRAAARNLAKLMSYKDEYEVARLYTLPAFQDGLRQTFGEHARLKFNLAPPMLSKRDPRTGHLQKREFGSWMLPAFGILSRFKFLRGTPFDVFGHTEERKAERRLIEEYMQVLEEAAPHTCGEKRETALGLAELPDMVRGYGHVKERNMQAYDERKADLLLELRSVVKAAAE